MSVFKNAFLLATAFTLFTTARPAKALVSVATTVSPSVITLAYILGGGTASALATKYIEHYALGERTLGPSFNRYATPFTTAAVVFLVIGLIALDEQAGTLQFSEITAQLGEHTGISEQERQAFNAERAHLNALLDQAAQEQINSNLPLNTLREQFVKQTEQELSLDAFSAYKKLNETLIARAAIP